MATLEDFENRAKQAEELIKILTSRLNDLEAAVKSGKLIKYHLIY